jgi:hypothetical protein
MNYECDAGDDVHNDVAKMLTMSFVIFYGSKLF